MHARRIQAACFSIPEDQIRGLHRIKWQPKCHGEIVPPACGKNSNGHTRKACDRIQQNLKCPIATQRKDAFSAEACLFPCNLREGCGALGTPQIHIPAALRCEPLQARQGVLRQAAAGGRVGKYQIRDLR